MTEEERQDPGSATKRSSRARTWLIVVAAVLAVIGGLAFAINRAPDYLARNYFQGLNIDTSGVETIHIDPLRGEINFGPVTFKGAEGEPGQVGRIGVQDRRDAASAQAGVARLGRHRRHSHRHSPGAQWRDQHQRHPPHPLPRRAGGKIELAQYRIRVNVVCPGAIETEIADSTEKRHLEAAEPLAPSLHGKIPLTGDRPGSSEDVAELILFLVSDRAKHITGTPT